MPSSKFFSRESNQLIRKSVIKISIKCRTACIRYANKSYIIRQLYVNFLMRKWKNTLIVTTFKSKLNQVYIFV